MMRIFRRIYLSFLAIAAASPVQAASSQLNLQGAWIEEGLSCASVFVATRNAVSFRRPANAFAPAFVISGKRLTTPLASCRMVNIKPSGNRQIMNLDCTTSVASNAARVVFAPAQDGRIVRYFVEGGSIAAKYQRCDRQDLKT